MAVGYSGQFLQVPDGITWTSQTSGVGCSGYFTGVTYSEPLGVVRGCRMAVQFFTSPDGITWTSRSSGVSAYPLTDVTYSEPFLGCSWL